MLPRVCAQCVGIMLVYKWPLSFGSVHQHHWLHCPRVVQWEQLLHNLQCCSQFRNQLQLHLFMHGRLLLQRLLFVLTQMRRQQTGFVVRVRWWEHKWWRWMFLLLHNWRQLDVRQWLSHFSLSLLCRYGFRLVCGLCEKSGKCQPNGSGSPNNSSHSPTVIDKLPEVHDHRCPQYWLQDHILR